MFSQLLEICRQLVESRTVIADTRRNNVVNSSELGFNIVSYRSNSFASRSNLSELGLSIVATRSNSDTTRRNSCFVAVLGKAPRKGTESIRTQVNSYLSQFVLILVNSYSVFGQFVLILLNLVNSYSFWSIRTNTKYMILMIYIILLMMDR